jgi:gliding motility-associated-like protein
MLYLKGTSSFGCVANDSVFIKVQQPFTLNVGKGDTLCVGEKTNLFATGADVYNWSPVAGLNNSGIANPVASPVQTTHYSVVVNDVNKCFYDTGFVDVVVYNIPTVNAGEDKTISVGDKVLLQAKASQDVSTILWKPSVGLDCIVRDAVTVFVVCNQGNFFVPNTFSPNNDGSNDVFYARGKGLNDIKSFKIFNRWGELVFEKQHILANDPAAGWDGRFNGVIANADVYVYLIEVVCQNSTVIVHKGDVTLLR